MMTSRQAGLEMEVLMSDTEKITINLSPVDLGRIDVLVEQGLYSNRTDLIRTAIRNQLDRHDVVIQDLVVRRSFTLGVTILDRKTLERSAAKGEQLSLRVVGLLHINDDVEPDLAAKVIRAVNVYGVLHAPAGVKDALADRVGKVWSWEE
jgi:Arc/MetJ-type ribon-helix-helix transcriptional regulator